MTDPNVIRQNLIDKGQWWEVSRNPIFGCSKCSPGCVNCWAEKQAMRLKRIGRPEYKDVVDENGWTGAVHFDATKLEKPIPGRGKVVFMCDMADIFYPLVNRGQRYEVLKFAMGQYDHRFIFCTKRAGQMTYFFFHSFDKELCVRWFGQLVLESHNVMGMVTVCNQEEADEKTPLLLECPWAKKGLSLEPLLGPIDVTAYLKDIDWVVVGAETGPGARRCKPEWIHSIVAQCEEADVPLFVKAYPLPNGKTSKNMREWPSYVRERQLPWKETE